MSTRSAPNVPVLMYHHVTPAGGMIAATPDVFEDQIARLARAGYQSLSADQFAACLAGAPVPERSVLITFDDGYLNNWVHAHPVLARHGMRAVLFIITGWIGDGPVRPHAGRARCPPRRTTTPASSWSPPAAPTRSCCAGARSRPCAPPARSNSIPIPTRTRAGTRNAPATSRPSAPASPTSCGCRARRWPAAWAASATTCAGRRVISTPTTWRRRARPASGTCTLPTLSARTRPARIPSTSTASRCAIAAAPGSTGASGCRATRSGVRATTPGKPGKAS